VIELTVASLPDRDRVVVELWRGAVQLAEVSKEDGTYRVEFYVEQGTNSLALELEELEEALGRARDSLG